jgi:hypothetical protein
VSFAEYVTEDRKCGKCGTAVEAVEGSPGLQTASSRGYMVNLTMNYLIKPCGHAFAIATGQERDL